MIKFLERKSGHLVIVPHSSVKSEGILLFLFLGFVGPFFLNRDSSVGSKRLVVFSFSFGVPLLGNSYNPKTISISKDEG